MLANRSKHRTSIRFDCTVPNPRTAALSTRTSNSSVSSLATSEGPVWSSLTSEAKVIESPRKTTIGESPSAVQP